MYMLQNVRKIHKTQSIHTIHKTQKEVKKLMKAQIIAIANNKGGVGKSTTAQMLVTGLTHRGLKALAVDTDPQTNLTMTAAINNGEKDDIYDLFCKLERNEKTEAESAIHHTANGYDIIAGSLELSGADMEFTNNNRLTMLRNLLTPVKEKYDYIVVDTPPTLGLLTINALGAADMVIIPVEADVYSIQGLAQMQGLIANVQQHINEGLKIEGLLVTRYNGRAVINKSLLQALQGISTQLGTKVFKTTIRESVVIKEIHYLQGDIFEKYPNHNLTTDYNSLINEILKGGN